MKYYPIDDYSTIRQRIYDTVRDIVSKSLNFEDEGFRLEVTDLHYGGKEQITPEDEKLAILYGTSLFRPLRGTIRLIDKASKRVISQEVKRIAAVPYITNRGTFILNGVEYSLINQQRLRPSVYFRLTNTGEYEAMVNAKGLPGHRFIFDPEDGKFYLVVRQSRIPLLPILSALGVRETELQRILGPELFSINQKENIPNVVTRAAQALTGIRPSDYTQARGLIKQFFERVSLDPDVTNITLGVRTNRVTPEILTLIVQRLLDNARQQRAIDDRNFIGFVRTIGPEDLIIEKVTAAIPRLTLYFNRARARRDVKYFPVGVLDDVIRDVIYGSRLGNALQEINPLEIYDNRYRVTRLGEGGISSHEQISDDLRWLQPSHFNFLDPLLTPEGESVGVDVRFPIGTVRDAKGNIYRPFISAKTNKLEYLTGLQLYNKVITAKEEWDNGLPYKRAIVNNQHVIVPKRRVDYIVPNFSYLFSPLTNLVPLKTTVYPHRVSMGARMITQAVPLVDPEPPLVRNMNPETGRSFDEEFGKVLGSRLSPVNGVVTQVRKDAIFIQDENGVRRKISLYVDFPFNRKTYYSEIPIVKAGDRVRKGQIIAHSNYTTPDGTLALGRNLYTAYIPWEGFNFEDAAVISESAARKLTSTHIYQNFFEVTSDIKLGPKAFNAIFPNQIPPEKLKNYNEYGVPLPGTVLEKGDPVVLAVREYQPILGKIGIRKRFLDASQLWEYDEPGVVLGAAITPNAITVLIKAEHAVTVGDKISGRYGDKHIISVILPDEQMPKDSQGRPFELLLNPLGLRRANLAQLYELFLGKVAMRKGQPYILPDGSLDVYQFVKDELAKAGLSDKEKIFLEKYNKEILAPVGYRYMMKLHHMAETKLGGRATGGYSSEDIPIKGGESGAKRIGFWEMLGILAHGAYHVARDARVIRGQRNEELWTRIMLGYDAPKLLDTPVIFTKFLSQLMAAGLNVRQRLGTLSLYALTNDDVKKLTEGREITNPELVEWRGDTLQPVEGGLFDPHITGGFEGRNWASIKLAIPLPNPLTVPVIRILLGLSERRLLDILFGRDELKGYGKGPAAITKALADININKEIEKTEASLTQKTGAGLDEAIRKLRYLKAMKENRVTPDQFMWERVPVIPPVFRPVNIIVGTGLPMVDDLNYLYKDLLSVNNGVALLQKHGVATPEDYELLYNALQAVIGLGDPIHPKFRAQGIKGLIPKIIGSRPKEGVVQRKLLGAQVDLVGRAVIVPNSQLDLNEVAIPEPMLWEIYKPFVVRRLSRKGIGLVEAAQMVKDKHPIARNALLQEMQERPVLISRAPVLHKHGIMAAWPKITYNNALEIHPFLVTGFGADFDGDTMQFHVPADPAAVKEAIEKMMPSKNLLNLQRFVAHIVPTMEYALGLYYLSKLKPDLSQPVRRFRNGAEVRAALLRGEIKPDTPVVLDSY